MKIVLIILGIITVWWLYQVTWPWFEDQFILLKTPSSEKEIARLLIGIRKRSQKVWNKNAKQTDWSDLPDISTTLFMERQVVADRQTVALIKRVLRIKSKNFQDSYENFLGEHLTTCYKRFECLS